MFITNSLRHVAGLLLSLLWTTSTLTAMFTTVWDAINYCTNFLWQLFGISVAMTALQSPYDIIMDSMIYGNCLTLIVFTVWLNSLIYMLTNSVAGLGIEIRNLLREHAELARICTLCQQQKGSGAHRSCVVILYSFVKKEIARCIRHTVNGSIVISSF